MVSPTGVRVTLHDVGAKKVAETRDFPLSGAPSSRQWRASLHAVSDAVEEWITGTRGIAATRIAFVRASHIYTVDSDGVTEARGQPAQPGALAELEPDGSHIAYSELANTGSRIGVIDLAQRTRIARSSRGRG